MAGWRKWHALNTTGMQDAGKLTLYKLNNIAENGAMPKDMLIPVVALFYAEKQIGVNRMYAALGANQRIDAFVRVFNIEKIPIDCKYAILNDGLQYRITLMQKIVNESAYDLTLERLDKNYDVINIEAENS